VRQLAWLQAVPHADTPVARSVSRPAEQRSRLQKILADGGEPLLPPLEAGGHLFELLMSIGPVLAGGMGPVPIDHRELRAWQDNTGHALAAWESVVLRRLSVEWLAESRLAEQPDRPAPWGAPEQSFDRAVVADRISAALKARAVAPRGVARARKKGKS